ncbi:MAG: hypothetical protein M3041_15225 [Acidobacteriota bacterium]|nr:hypothetical protein [Acidobacteriota bacterium]
MSRPAQRCRAKFLRFFPDGFRDETYIDWERGYKWEAHEKWQAALGKSKYLKLLRDGNFDEIARIAVQIESRTNLLFSFEKMALRDAVRMDNGAQQFARGLYDFLHGRGGLQQRFERWCEVVASLPVTRAAAREYGLDFQYRSKPNWDTYTSLVEFARTVERDQSDLQPRDMIDLQSFIWVLGSDEYEE